MTGVIMAQLVLTTHVGPSRVSTSVTVDYDMAMTVGSSFVLGAGADECRFAHVHSLDLPEVLMTSRGCVKGRAEITPAGRAALALGDAYIPGVR